LGRIQGIKESHAVLRSQKPEARSQKKGAMSWIVVFWILTIARRPFWLLTIVSSASSFYSTVTLFARFLG
jgi:hypothetical protein